MFNKKNKMQIEDLAESQAKLKAVLDNIVDGLITIDEAGLIQSYNKACERMFGYTLEEVLGKNISMLMPEPHAARHDSYLQNYCHSGHAKIIGIGRELEGKRKDNSVFPMDLSVAEVKVGSKRIFSGIVRDITYRKASEKGMALLASIVASSSDAIISKDMDGIITSWNSGAEKLFGYSSTEIVGKHLSTLIPDDKIAEEANIIQSLKDGKLIEHYETIRVSKNGRRIHVSLSISPIRNIAGEIVGAAKNIRDITHKKRTEDKLRGYMKELEDRNRELDGFAYVASHDLKAPLRNIDNLAQWIIEDTAEILPPDSKKNLTLLRQRIFRLETLLDDILAYSRAGRVVDAPASIDVNKLVRQLTQTHLPLSFSVEIRGVLPTLTSFYTPLEQIFGNIFTNAVKHHDRESGKIRVESIERGEFIEFIVTDDGPGIPPEFHSRVFQMFQTLQPRDKLPGSGLGMSIIKKLVEWQDGRAWIKSDHNQRGTAVHFTWPREAKTSNVLN